MIRRAIERVITERSVRFAYDPDRYWEQAGRSYDLMPSVRHRKRFILRALDRYPFGPRTRVFDYGCGIGNVLVSIRDRFRLDGAQLGGCEISGRALAVARERLGEGADLSGELFPSLRAPLDVVVCTEVIEHTTDYREILDWIFAQLNVGGWLILTTQTGAIHASDRYTGHTQHFRLDELCDGLREIGYSIESARLWGFPLFTLQKYLTDVDFDRIKDGYVEGAPTLRRKLVFELAYRAFRLLDPIDYGPQIYVVATKKK